MSENKGMKMEAEKILKGNLKLHCVEPIPTIYCDGFQGLSFTKNIVKLNLIEEKLPSPENEVIRQVIARLAMPTEVFLNFVDVLVELKAGMITRLDADSVADNVPVVN